MAQPEPVRVAARTAIAGIGMTSIGGRVELAFIPSPPPRKMIRVPTLAPRPSWAHPAMDLEAFREARRWAAEGWAL